MKITRLKAALHELRCRQCRVTWPSWAQRLAGMRRGHAPKLAGRHCTLVERAKRAERARDGWEADARTYSKNADYWQERAERTETALDDHKAELLNALGMDPQRDWDDIVNAARSLRKQRDQQREAP